MMSSAARGVRRRARLKADGLCVDCGRVPVSGTGCVTCGPCRARYTAHYLMQRSKGLCVTCGHLVGDARYAACFPCRAGRAQRRSPKVGATPS